MSKSAPVKKTEIKFKSLFSNTIHEVLTKRPGWKETDKDDWDFIWADKVGAECGTSQLLI